MQHPAFAMTRTSVLPSARPRARPAGAFAVLALLAACASAQPPGAAPTGQQRGRTVIEERTTDLDGEQRSYRVFVPDEGARGLPMLVLLHGCTQTAADLAAGTRMDEVAGEMGFIVVYPEQPNRVQPMRCWRWYEPAHQSRDAGEPALIAAIARREIADRAADPARVYVAGISAGALMAVATALAYPELFAAVGVHSGAAHGIARDVAGAVAMMRSGAGAAAEGRGAEALARAMDGHSRVPPLIILHGADDAVVVPGNADDLAGQWQALARLLPAAGGGLTQPVVDSFTSGGRPVDRLRWRDGDGGVVLERWRIAGLGHAWSGGSTEGSYTDPAGPDASRVIARFLLAHRRP